MQPALISMKVDGYEETKGMTEAQNPAVEWIIANTQVGALKVVRALKVKDLSS
jgi:hypothetical protein